MEMCYDGALVMPSSYALMSEDEMTYVEGGFHISQTTVQTICSIATLGVAAATYVKQFGMPRAITLIGTKICAVSKAILNFVKTNIAGIIVGIVIGLGIAYLAPKFAEAACKRVGIEITWKGASVSSY